MIERATIVAAARGWLGTPYHHQAALGAKVDDAGAGKRGTGKSARTK